MKQFKKGFAITGGVMAMINLAFAILSWIAGRAVGAPWSLLSFVMPVLTLFTGIALFRGKKDALPGIAYTLTALYMLLMFVVSLSSLSVGIVRRFWYYHINPENLLLAAALAFMALDAFLDFKMNPRVKAVIPVVLLVAGFLFDQFAYGLYIYHQKHMLGFDIQMISYIFGVMIGQLVSALPLLLCRIFAALAGATYAAPSAAQAAPRPVQAVQPQQPQLNWYGYLPAEQQPQYQAPQAQSAPVRAAFGGDPKDHGFIGMGSHIALCLLTFGIWPLIWIFKTTETLNKAPGVQPKSAGAQLALCLLVPFYLIFWFAGHGKRADAYAQKAGVSGGCATLCIILAIFFPLGAYIVLQSKINEAAQAMAG